MVDLLGGDGGLAAEDAFGGVRITIVEREVRAAYIHAEPVTGGEGCGDGSEVDGDLVDLSRLH